MKQHPIRRSPLALAVLGLLYGAPMHPYRIQQLIKEWGKDQVINVQQRASIYQTIERLLRAGLIAIVETTRDERWPERTVYQLTDEGRAVVVDWIRDMLATPSREYPEFPAALAFLPLVPPDEVRQKLETRIEALAGELARIDAGFAGPGADLPRLFLIEAEYQRAILEAELTWVRSVVEDLRTGRLTWSEEGLRQYAATLRGDQPEEDQM